MKAAILIATLAASVLAAPAPEVTFAGAVTEDGGAPARPNATQSGKIDRSRTAIVGWTADQVNEMARGFAELKAKASDGNVGVVKREAEAEDTDVDVTNAGEIIKRSPEAQLPRRRGRRRRGRNANANAAAAAGAAGAANPLAGLLNAARQAGLPAKRSVDEAGGDVGVFKRAIADEANGDVGVFKREAEAEAENTDVDDTIAGEIDKRSPEAQRPRRRGRRRRGRNANAAAAQNAAAADAAAVAAPAGVAANPVAGQLNAAPQAALPAKRSVDEAGGDVGVFKRAVADEANGDVGVFKREAEAEAEAEADPQRPNQRRPPNNNNGRVPRLSQQEQSALGSPPAPFDRTRGTKVFSPAISLASMTPAQRNRARARNPNNNNQRARRQAA
ncbi:hypothetical protein PYCC9005_004641 [Savitreella phatthalungensis]